MPKPAPLSWNLVRRILSRLCAAEAQEPNPWLRDDLQIARLILAHAARGDAVCCTPHVLASYEVLGLHPEKVWPAIQKRREALGPLEVLDAVPPKKPPQSVKLWCEQNNGARAANSRAGDVTVLREPSVSVPMAAPSIAAAYPNSDEYESEKSSSPFARIAQVRASTLAERHRNLIVAMLHKNRFGDELWMSTDSVRVVMGRVCYRRKTTETDTRGRKLHACEEISRRAVQRLIDEVVALGVLAQVYDANQHVPYGGGKRFRHTATYRLNPDKLVPRRTHNEYVEERDRARAKSRQTHREQSQRDHHEASAQAEPTPIRKPSAPAEKPLPPAPATPLPKREKPAAEHRSNTRADNPDSQPVRITREVRTTLFTMYVTLKKTGMNDESAFREIARQMQAKFPDLSPAQVRVELAIQSAKKADQEERHATGSSAATDRVNRNRESLVTAARDHVAGRAGPDSGERKDGADD